MTSMAVDSPCIGLVTLGHIEPTPGMASHPDSYEPPVLRRAIRGERLVERAIACEPTLLDEISRHAEVLIADGARVIVTTVGYFIRFQKALAQRLPVPVFTSSLMLGSAALAVAGGSRMLVFAAVTEGLTDACLRAASIPVGAPVVVRGMEGRPHFAEMVLRAGGVSDAEALRKEIADAVVDAVEELEDIGAIVIECADMSVASEEVRSRTGLPVFDYLGLAAVARAGVSASP